MTMIDRNNILRFILILSAAISGCSQNNGGGLLSGDDGETWQIVVKRLSGPNQQQISKLVYDSLLNVPNLDKSKIKIITLTGNTVVVYGTYRTIDDPTAQNDLRFLKSLMIPDEGYPFLDAHLEPMIEHDPSCPSDWLIANTDGYWTLQIAVWHGKNRKQHAVDFVRKLREENIPAYVYHGPVKSLILVGAFPYKAVDTSAKREIRREISPRDPKLKQWKQKFPYLLMNGDYAVIKTTVGAPTNQRMESVIMKIPRQGESLW